MKVRPISEHGVQLTRFGLVNCYLVRETDGFTLIDTGLSGSAEAILAAARTFGSVAGAMICRIVLTHAHSDHIGSLDQLSHLLGTSQVAVSSREARLLPKKPAQDRSLDPSEPQTPVKGGFPGASTAPTHLLSAGELYGSLRCIPTPGHTPGHFSFLDERDGTLYAGDALVTVGSKPTISGHAPWYFPLPNLATWHAPTARASIENLLNGLTREAPMQRLAPGHGPVLEGGGGLLRRALEAAH